MRPSQSWMTEHFTGNQSMTDFATGHCGTEGKQSTGGHSHILGENAGNPVKTLDQIIFVWWLEPWNFMTFHIVGNHHPN